MIDLAKKNLDLDDRVQKSWSAQLGAKHGFLVLSNKKLLFIEEKGLIRMAYNLVLKILYEKIDEITVEDRKLVITDVEGTIHNFTSSFASRIETTLRNRIK